MQANHVPVGYGPARSFGAQLPRHEELEERCVLYELEPTVSGDRTCGTFRAVLPWFEILALFLPTIASRPRRRCGRPRPRCVLRAAASVNDPLECSPRCRRTTARHSDQLLPPPSTMWHLADGPRTFTRPSPPTTSQPVRVMPLARAHSQVRRLRFHSVTANTFVARFAPSLISIIRPLARPSAHTTRYPTSAIARSGLAHSPQLSSSDNVFAAPEPEKTIARRVMYDP